MPAAQRLAVASAMAVALLCLVYAAVLAIGLFTLPTPQHPIGDPWFTSMEVLILAIAPAMVALAVGIHAQAAPADKPFAVAAIAFMAMCALVTCSVHFCVLTLSRQAGFAGQAWVSQVFAFRWPSVAYALDILAWDFFFPLGAVFAARTVRGTGQAAIVRRLLYASAVLAFVGLAGVPLADMQLRNIGIVGYALVFPAASALLARLLGRPRSAHAG